jgi:hypothetical protein
VTLWTKAVNTLRVNLSDTWTDCPDRERANWIGDATIDLGQTPYVFDARGELTTRESILDVMRWQRPDQTIFAPVPEGASSMGELPMQILATVGKYGVLRYYQNNGDIAFLQQSYPAIKSYLLNVWQTNSQGLVVHRDGNWNWYDWGNNIDQSLLDNTWYLFAVEAAAQIAALVGRSADVPAFTSRAQGIRNQFNATFWNGSAYRSSGYSGGTDERGNAMAVLAGLADSSKTAALRNVLTANQNASPYMEKYVLEALFALGYPDDALNRMRSRYSAMISASPSTLWETFPAGGTFNHGWSGGPLMMMAEKTIGLTLTSPGFTTFDVQPALGTTLTRASLDVPSRHGLIRIAISRNGSNKKLSVRVPPGATGRAIQPSGGTLSGAILSIEGGATATLDETVVPAEINVLDGNATLQSAISGTGAIAKTGVGTLNIGASGTLAAGAFSVSQGEVVVSSGGQLAVSGSLTNNGTLLLTGNAQLNVSGTFVNTGVLDIINWNGALPAGFVNTGIILDRSAVKVQSCEVNGADFTLTIMGYAGHGYQLEWTSDLNVSAWTDIGPSKIGEGGLLVFTHTNGVVASRSFYRVRVSP